MIARSDFFPALPSREPVLHTTTADRVVSWLMALLFCLTLTVLFLGMIWMSGGTTDLLRFGGVGPGPEVELLPGAAAPPIAELVVDSPQDETQDPSVEVRPNGVQVLTATLEQLEKVEGTNVEGPPADGIGDGGGGDGPPPPPPPPHEVERWVFVIDGIAGIDDYAQLLADTGIELGAFDRNNQFQYLTDATAAKPAIRAAVESRDERFFTRWRKGNLADLDRQLFVRGGVQLRGDGVVHFFNKPLELQLAAKEREAARKAGKRVARIRRTWFTVDRDGGRFGFKVLRQQFVDYNR